MSGRSYIKEKDLNSAPGGIIEEVFKIQESNHLFEHILSFNKYLPNSCYVLSAGLDLLSVNSLDIQQKFIEPVLCIVKPDVRTCPCAMCAPMMYEPLWLSLGTFPILVLPL